MKKFSVVLVLMMLVVAFAGCTEPAAVDPGDDEPEAAPIAKLGLGHINSIAKSSTERAQVDTTIAAVGFDSEGKVVSVSIDVAQTRVEYDENREITSDLAAEYLTKMERGDDYGMKARSEIGKEWFEQITALEEWMVGKTADEITAMEVTERDEAHTHVPAVEELTSSVTITVESYLAAVAEAWDNAIDIEGGAETVGLGHVISIAKSKSEQAQVDTTIAATAFDADSNVAEVIIDVAQIRVAYDEEGNVTTDMSVDHPTKVEKGDDYGMKARSEIGLEWWEQMLAFEDWMIGKSVAEIMAMELEEDVPTNEELTSSVTISVGNYLAAVEESAANAK